MTGDVLQVKGLQVYYGTREGQVNAVNDVSFTLEKDERLGLVDRGHLPLAMGHLDLVADVLEVRCDCGEAQSCN